MKHFGFQPPQERIEPRLWTADRHLSNVNVGKFVRNSVLSGKTFGDSDLTPAWIKTRDAVHPMLGRMNDVNNIPISAYGAFDASAVVNSVGGILVPRNTTIWWSPGGNGIGSWLSVKLTEATFVESYAVGTKSASTPLSWVLQGSMDGTAWADLHTVDNTGMWDATYELKEFTIPEETKGAYIYYKLNITASNATTMSLRNFRLFRPTSVCGKGQIMIDASSVDPLLLSFADGFDPVEGTPLDIIESITSPIVKDMFGGYGDTLTRPASSTYVQRVNLFAVRDSSGNISLEAKDARGVEITQASGGMLSAIDKGWSCSVDYANCYKWFGATTGSGQAIPSKSPEFRIIGDDGVYATQLNIYMLRNDRTAVPVYAIEMDETLTEIGRSSTYGSTYFRIDRRIKGIKYTTASTGITGGILLYTTSSPTYRMIEGKLYELKDPNGPLVPCHKIRIGSCVLNPASGEVVDFRPHSAFDMVSMVNGNVDTDITG